MPAASPIWSSLSLRITFAMVAVVAVVLVPGFVAESSLVSVRRENARAEQASTAMREYLMLQVLGDSIEQKVGAGGLRSNADRAAAFAAIEGQLGKIDRATGNEVSIISGSSLAPEMRAVMLDEEQRQQGLTAIIRNSLHRRIEGADDSAWRAAAMAGIAGEQAEVREAQVGAVGALERTQVAFFAAGVVLAIGALGVLLWLRGNVLHPLRRLLTSTRRIASGDFGADLPESGPREFRFLNRSFNAMATQIEGAQARLAAANQRLEDDVRQRTADLVAANQSLHALNDQRRDFLAEAGHELRTPLAVLRSEADVALRAGQPSVEALRTSLERIVRNAAVLARLVEDMLRIARAEAPVMAYELVSVDLAVLADAALDEFRALVEADGGTAMLVADAGPILVRIDPLRIGQVLRILFDNALKHSSNEPSLCIVIREEPGMAVIEVADRGDGMDPSLIPHLFDRVGRPRRRGEGSNLGLGLPIAASIIEAHGGTIAVRSEEGSGTTVSIRLPRDPLGDGEICHEQNGGAARCGC
ncbi:HAMP domain-containing histidine kinase [Novosphingobium sp. KCTC 2891]|uniref:sensor histidine kinase n=1 Tax=Novosphingobium sp. KCTC 2891 TaxID=2989730 RepID=UPI0022235EE6|nr:HAMP domain-containing sensor histidine kinase [Novosphingobium sp. KCTC 2891]MCW1383038.1 HAMP domain-containing histidine kinase [Novosphingobium sp. KCTC 2891]